MPRAAAAAELSWAEGVVHLSAGSSVAQQQPEAASPSSHSSDFNNAPLAVTSPWVTPSVSPKNPDVPEEHWQTSQENTSVMLFFYASYNSKSTAADLQDYKPHIESLNLKQDPVLRASRWIYNHTPQPVCEKKLFCQKESSPPRSMLISFRVQLTEHHFRMCCASQSKVYTGG